jgi:hypothetical protein
MKYTIILAGLLVCLSAPAMANPIERACLSSDQAAANRNLCACIGRVADQTLSRSQMRDGARFFSDPQRAQNVRMSDRPSHEAMWQAWRNFGDRATATCG